MSSFINTKGKLNRTQYLLRLLVLAFVITLLDVILAPTIGSDQSLLVVTIVQLIGWYVLMIQRLRSMGKNPQDGWLWVVGFFIPLLNIILSLRLLLTAPKEEIIHS